MSFITIIVHGVLESFQPDAFFGINHIFGMQYKIVLIFRQEINGYSWTIVDV